MKSLDKQEPLCTAQWLKTQINNSNLIILNTTINPKSVQKIPNAIHFDYDKKICDVTNPLPHMMPSPKLFEEEVRKLGINNSSEIVVYDEQGNFYSPRAYYMFKAMGNNKVRILNGGLPAWLIAGGPTQNSRLDDYQVGDFQVQNPKLEIFCNKLTVEKAIDDKKFTILDARSKGRFLGLDPEPREGLRRGNIPNSINFSYTNVLNEQGLFLEKEELIKVFPKNIDFNQHLIFSCGSGITACIIALAAEIIGYKNVTIYDGSWSEWGRI